MTTKRVDRIVGASLGFLVGAFFGALVAVFSAGTTDPQVSNIVFGVFALGGAMAGGFYFGRH